MTQDAPNDRTLDLKSERGQEVETLFLRALDQPTEQRSAFLDQHCAGDPWLRDQVENLLANASGVATWIDGAIGGVLDAMVDEDPGPSAQNAGALPPRIGPYRVLGLLGRGGMGAVYRAERDDEHYRAQVALKVLGRGLQDPLYLSRLRQERQILAHLDHPGISRLLDGGNTDDGLPYFVMEFVDGEPIDRHCDHHRLTIRQRLELFLGACEAVHYAHRNLVVHRDLKPPNLLVTSDGQPKLLDFGIAKLLDQGLSDPLFTPTLPGVRLLTPRYASPEQIRGEPLGTSTDIYSLGVLLYELLTGHPPHDATELRALERAICNDPPQLPSEAVTRPARAKPGPNPAQDSAAPKTLSALRKSTPQRLRRRLAGDLDTILLMALRKEPERRYATVGQLAEDIRRHLEGRPVLARPDTLAYRGGKFLRRHWQWVTTVALVLATVVSLVVFYTQQLAEERDLAQQARDRAEHAATRSAIMADSLKNTLMASHPNRAQGRELTARDLLDEASRRLENDLVDYPDILWEMQDILVTVYLELDYREEAAALAEKSLQGRQRLLGDDHPDLAISLKRLGDLAFEAYDLQRAADYFERALELRRSDASQAQDPVRAALALAEACQDLGVVDFYLKRYQEAEALFRESLEIRQRHLPSDDPLIADAMDSLSHIFEFQGQLEVAESWVRQALELRLHHHGPSHTDTALGHTNVGFLLRELGRPQAAEEHFRQALEIYVQLLPENHHDLAEAHSNLGYVLNDQGLFAEAIPHFEWALGQEPGFKEAQRGLACAQARDASPCAPKSTTQ